MTLKLNNRIKAINYMKRKGKLQSKSIGSNWMQRVKKKEFHAKESNR